MHPAWPTGLLLALALAGSWGCSAIPRGLSAVDSVSVEGNHEVSSDDIEARLATTSSPKFLYVFPGFIYDYELYDRSVLQRDLQRVERYYRARGFYEAQARAGRVRHRGDDHVEVTIEVEEGLPVLVRGMRVDGLEGLAEKDAAAVKKAMTAALEQGKPFEEEPFRKAEVAMRRVLTDRGRAWAKVERRADVDLPAHHATLYFNVQPGPKATFGAVKISGLGDLPEAPVRRALDIEAGEPYSTSALEAAEQAALNLGTFSSVEITPELPEPPPADAVVPLAVRVQRQKLRSVLLGGGVEIDSIRTAAHLHVGWEHRNLFGGFRHFTVDFKPGLNLYPTRLPEFQAPTAVLPAERLRAELRQPGFIEARTNGVLSQELNTYPVLLTPTVDPAAPVIGYLEYRGSIGLDRTFWKLFGAPTYNLQSNLPFAYSGKLDSNLRGVVLSYVDLLAQLDLRDSNLRPHEGLLVRNDVQVAGLGGDAVDVRVQPEIRGYIPFGKKVTLAARASVGFLFPFNYGDAAEAARKAPPEAGEVAAWTQDIQLIYLRGFFSGGPSSNRGYPLRGVGPHGVVPFYSPDVEAQKQAADCAAGSKSYDAARCAVPLGGLSLWEASLELRFPIAGSFSGSTFCDAGDVSSVRLDLRFDYPHLSCGVGLRYDTPIGPVRLDVGYRIPGAQFPSGADLRIEGEPGTLYGVPVAFAFGIGEAF